MITKIYNGKIVTESEILTDLNIYVEDGKIAEITSDNLPCDNQIDADGNYISAGFIDLHTHGAKDCDFASGSPEEIVKAANYHCQHGTTTIYPTTLSSSIDELEKGLDNIKVATDDDALLPNIYGVHLEGPYFSLNQSGAQNPEFITPPVKADYMRILDKFGSFIKRWSYAPEHEGSEEFAQILADREVAISIAHSDAKYDDVMAVYNKGCRLITHFYSCMSTITREKGYRKLGVIECGYLLDDMYVEAIADGHHIPAELFKVLFKIKGSDKICLVTDSIMCCGADTEFADLGGVPCKIKNGVAYLMDESAFAGSVATTDQLVRFCVQKVGISLWDAVKMITLNPAKVMGLESKGKIAPGYDADMVIFDEDITVKKVIVNGKLCN